MLHALRNKVINAIKGEGEFVVNFIPNMMKRVHKDKDGNLASRMVRQFTPLVNAQQPEPKKPLKVWYGDKVHKAIIKGRCAGVRTEGVAGGALRLMKQERMLDKLQGGSPCLN